MLQDTGFKIVIATSGSRGDTQPYIALGLALRARGHSVSIATERRMQGLVEEFGLDYRMIGGDPTGILWEPKAQDVLKNGSMLKLIALTKEWEAKFDKTEILNSYIAACSGADLIICAALTMTQTYCVSEYLQCAWVPMILGPTWPTKEFPLWLMKSLVCCCSCLNKWTYTAAFSMLWNSERTIINNWRQNMLGLSPITNKGGMMGVTTELGPPVIIACSPMICGPFGRKPADYPSFIQMHGFIFVPNTEESKVDPALVSFLQSDPLATSSENMRPVIYLGFGSMPAPNPLELLRVAVHTCNLISCRAVLVAGWTELDSSDCQAMLAEANATSTLLVTKAAPHDWLFPRMKCIVHHCGVGTMAAALRSGIPQVPCPVMLDQPFNATTVVRLGCAPGVMPFSKLTAQKLAPLVAATFANDRTGNEIRRCAQLCGERVRLECATACDKYVTEIEQHALTHVAEKGKVIRRKESTSSTGSLGDSSETQPLSPPVTGSGKQNKAGGSNLRVRAQNI
jgi:sterol 3beta-glucosyltransferase